MTKDPQCCWQVFRRRLHSNRDFVYCSVSHCCDNVTRSLSTDVDTGSWTDEYDWEDVTYNTPSPSTTSSNATAAAATISIIWFTNRRYSSQWTQRQTHIMADCTPCSDQEERRSDKTPAHTIKVASLMTYVDKSVVTSSVDNTATWSYGKWDLLSQQFLPPYVRAPANFSYLSTIMHQHTGVLEKSACLPVIL